MFFKSWKKNSKFTIVVQEQTFHWRILLEWLKCGKSVKLKQSLENNFIEQNHFEKLVVAQLAKKLPAFYEI
jgi:hypothetical protein